MAATPPPDWTERVGVGRGLWLSVAEQRLHLVEGGRSVRNWPCSTSRHGIGTRSGSHRTPDGWHEIADRIGAGAPPGTVFEERRPTGRVWRGGEEDRDLILTRILRLRGCEEGRNRGGVVDSYDRFIYLHGTNAESALGQPASIGCVRLSNADVVEVFDLAPEGTPLLIDPGNPHNAGELPAVSPVVEGMGFRELVDRHWRACFALGYRLTRDAATAEDLAQEAFLRLYRNLGKLGPDAKFGAWLRRTVVNLVIDRSRRASRRPEVPLAEGAEVAAPEAPADDGFAEAVRGKLLGMPRRETEVFTLRVLEGLSTRETAEALEVGEGTVRRYLHDAVHRLRDSLAGWNGTKP